MADYYSELMRDMNEDIQERDAQAKDITALVTRQSELALAQAEASKKAGMVIGGSYETPESFALKTKADLEAKIALRKQGEAMDYSSLSFDIAQATAKETRNAMQVAEKIKQDSAVSFWDSPVTALENAFTLPWDQQALAGSQQQLDVLNKAKQELDARIVGAARSTDLLKNNIDEATVASLNAAMKESFNAQSAAADLNVIGNRLKGIQEIAQADARTTDILFKRQQALYGAQEQSRQQATFKMAQELNSERLSDRKKLTEGRAGMIQSVRVAMENNNIKLAQQPSDEEIFAGLSADRNSTAGKIYSHFLDRGTLLKLGMQPSDGENVAERVQNRMATGAQPASIQERVLWDLEQAEYGKLRKTVKDPIAASAAAQIEIDRKMKTWEGLVVPGDKTNPLAPPSFGALLSPVFAGLQKTPGFSVLAKLAKEKPNEPINPDFVINALADGILAKEISPNMAAVLFDATYKNILMSANHISKAEKTLGKGFEAYNVNIESSAMYSEAFKGIGASATLAGLSLALVPGVGTVPGLAFAGAGAGTYAVAKNFDQTTINAVAGPEQAALLLNRAVIRRLRAIRGEQNSEAAIQSIRNMGAAINGNQ